MSKIYENTRNGGGDPVRGKPEFAKYHRVPFACNNGVDARFVQRSLPATEGRGNSYTNRSNSMANLYGGMGVQECDAVSVASKSVKESNGNWRPQVQYQSSKSKLTMKITESRFSGFKDRETGARPRFEYVPRLRNTRSLGDGGITAKITEVPGPRAKVHG